MNVRVRRSAITREARRSSSRGRVFASAPSTIGKACARCASGREYTVIRSPVLRNHAGGKLRRMKWWAMRVALLVLVMPALIVWGLFLTPWLGYFLPPAAFVAFAFIERRFERWLRTQFDVQ